ncbi:MAG: redox-sensing transcriptional repressor Rex [Anaerohalosphaeraceae bacterium]|nr:redox-sensing transcriptional repressor Rex [Anaerohalosphaeraceae bacterium]
MPEKTIERLSLYRRIVENYQIKGEKSAYSHEIAKSAGVTSSQVRRDFMFIGTNGRANSGYDLDELAVNIEKHLLSDTPDKFCLVGVGNLGTAILAFFHGRRANLIIKTAFDKDPELENKIVHGCRCYSIDEVERAIKEENISIGIIAVPAAEAQGVAEVLVSAGIRGIINFAPVHLNVTDGIFVENVDLTMHFEKVAHFTRLVEK